MSLTQLYMYCYTVCVPSVTGSLCGGADGCPGTDDSPPLPAAQTHTHGQHQQRHGLRRPRGECVCICVCMCVCVGGGGGGRVNYKPESLA